MLDGKTAWQDAWRAFEGTMGERPTPREGIGRFSFSTLRSPESTLLTGGLH
jgi:hypothetical protein